jgi:flavin reductase
MIMVLDQEFRAAMRRLAATVNVVTVSAEGEPMGLVATSVASLAAAPPSILVCVNQSASIHSALTKASRFCVNILHRDQIDVARVFSDSSLRYARFVTGRWEHGGNAPPYLNDAQCVLSCALEQITTFGTHSICVGTVSEVRLRPDIDPLVYVDGRYARVA